VGGESTRPGSDPVDAALEMRRVLPVIEALAKSTQAVISIDTTKAAVAHAAVRAGAAVINDVTALRGDPGMPAVAVETGAAVVLMHMLGTPKTMQTAPRYDDVVAEVKAFLAERAGAAQAAGVKRERIVIDPGIGFGKTVAHNLTLIRHLDALGELGHPVLLGASRKAFIGALTGREPLERLWGTMGVHVAAALLGAQIVRVHDVAPLKEALTMSDAIARA
jgi:dihydropteroate synthase